MYIDLTHKKAFVGAASAIKLEQEDLSKKIAFLIKCLFLPRRY